MKRLAALLALFVLLQAAPASDKWAPTDFSHPDFFPILPWSPLTGWDGKALDWKTNGLESLAACHFNMAGFVRPADLAKCRQLGLAAIILAPPNKELPLKYQREWRQLTDPEIDRRVRAMVKAAGSSPALQGYFIMDEPGVRDFPALAKAVAAVKKYAPGKLAYINLFPDYATLGAPDSSQLGTSNYTEYLERFVTEVNPQLLSYDNYMVQYSDDLKNRKLAASYFRNLLEVRRVGQKYRLPCLQIVAANQLRPKHPVPSPANLSLQAYTTLAAGFRGVTWYTYYGRGYEYAPVDRSGKRTLTWAHLSEVNRQVATLAPVLGRLTSTGVYFTAPPLVDGLPLLPGKLVEAVACPAPIMVGEFTGPGGESYALLVNLSLEQSVSLKIQTTVPGQKIQQLSAMDCTLRPFEQDKDGFWLTAGQGVLLRLGD